MQGQTTSVSKYEVSQAYISLRIERKQAYISFEYGQSKSASE